jgi:hypothetical protein
MNERLVKNEDRFKAECLDLIDHNRVSVKTKLVNATVLLKMYSVTTRDMMNSNLSMAARCIPALSSPSSIGVSIWMISASENVLEKTVA